MTLRRTNIPDALYMGALGFALLASLLLTLWLQRTLLVFAVVLGSVLARRFIAVEFSPVSLWIERKILMIAPLIAIVTAVVSLTAFGYGFANLDRCHENPNCDPDVLVIPFLLGYVSSVFAVVWSESVFWVVFFARR